MNKIIYTFIICFGLIGCKSINIEHEHQRIIKNNILLGSIGEQGDFIIEQDHDNVTLPQYEHPVKVEVTSVPFAKSSYKAFEKAKQQQSANISIDYVDSIPSKPRFLKLEIADKIEILNAFNNKQNEGVKNYLANNMSAHIVSGISIGLSSKDLNALVNAEEVFLERSGLKSYALRTYKNSKLQQSILFNSGVIFGYKASYFCWQERTQNNLQIVDITEFDKCSKGTYRNSKRAKKKIDYFKF